MDNNITPLLSSQHDRPLFLSLKPPLRTKYALMLHLKAQTLTKDALILHLKPQTINCIHSFLLQRSTKQTHSFSSFEHKWLLVFSYVKIATTPFCEHFLFSYSFLLKTTSFFHIGRFIYLFLNIFSSL